MSTMEEDRIPENVLFSPLSTSSTHTDSYSQYDQPLPPRFYDRYFSSSSDDESDNHKLTFDSKKLDYMMQFLDRKLSSSTPASNSQHNRGLPEFIAKGGGTGIFQLPLRAAVHPSRPPSLELRPRPLRETQVGCSLKNLVSTSSQLWAGTDCGLRVWEFRDLYGARSSGEVGTGDEETAPFKESVRKIAVNCVVGDEGNGVVWSGHNDGRIRCWKMHQNGSGFKEDLSWQAHSGPVLSVIITSYGDLWSGSESGIIMIWPREASEKAFSLSMEERQLAALLMERSCVDLRSQISFSNMFTSDIKYLLSDNSRAKVWSAGYLSFALWDARTKELLKVFNVDGQIENRIDMSSVQDHAIEDDVKMRITFNLKKEKSQSSISFLQRSRNAIIGAADAVRRAAVKGAFGDDNRRTEALVISMDGMIWAGCANGLLVRWDGNGNRLQEFQYHSFAVQCFCTFGSRIWVGYASGTVQVIDLEGNLLGGWQAHGSPVISMAVGAGYIFTLANQGGVRGWIITSPAPLDFILRSELACKEFLYTRLEKLKILTGTWNVGQGRPSHDSLLSWLFYGAADADLVVVGLQEVEMGAGFLAMSAAKETVGLEGSSVGQLWLDMIGNALGEGPKFERISSRQLAGLLISVWVKIDLKDYVGDVDAAAVPCGFGRAIGNKGAVGLRMRVYGRKMCFVNCHFAAHLEAVNRRNADFDHVYRTMTFSRPSNFLNTAAAGVSSAVQMLRGTNAMSAQSMEELPDLSEADMVVFLGDFNYRLCDISYDEARDFISQRCFDWLREKDQLRAQMEAGNVCQGMREAVILFPPTYKFERHRAGLTGYDSGERKRTPAWCDRILYRDSRAALESDCSLQYPVVSSILQYEACMDVTDSDHKPVRCVFSVEIARVDESVRRQEYGEIIGSNKKAQSLLKVLSSVPEIIISTNNIILQNSETFVLRITNRSERNDALFEIVASRGQSAFKKNGRASDSLLRVSHGFPRWLEVSPALGIIRPDQIMEVSVHHAESQTPEEFVDGIAQNWWIEESREKEVILVVKVRGALSTASKDHRVRVCQCLSTKSTRRDSEPTGNLLRHSDIQKLSGSYEVVDHFKNLHSP